MKLPNAVCQIYSWVARYSAQMLGVSAFGGFLIVQQAARRVAPRGAGAILATGATASVKSSPQSAAFAMGTLALRGVA
jgi:NAD(P)-dependent dehydrogenase (short-subunit alcohol dehydrogenase family)